MNAEYDFAIVGSGFGGSVAALRLAEKGYSVVVLEKGRRFDAATFPKSNWDVRRYLWIPALRCYGIQSMKFFGRLMVLSGTGVGGGSLVYANTLPEPADAFFEAPQWKGLADWKQELGPHYATARRMLGATRNPKQTFVDETLRECADELGRGDTFKTVEVGVFFGDPGRTVPDPYFGGRGPERAGCIECGGCMVGCRHNAKNTLDKNYLYLAENLGVRILPESQVTCLRPAGGGWELDVERSTAWFAKQRRQIRVRQVVLAGGVLGTTELLLRCKLDRRTLPRLSDRLGHEVRTNSEALIAVSEPDAPKSRDYSRGVAITSSFRPDADTSVEPVRYPAGSNLMRIYMVPLVAGGTRGVRVLRLMAAILRRPWLTLRLRWDRRWSEKTVLLLVMQTVESSLRFRLGRNFNTLFRRSLRAVSEPGARPVESYVRSGHRVADAFARRVGGIVQSGYYDVFLNAPVTAHILGGCPIGADASRGVVDARHRVFGYEGLYVCDGSVIPANLGVNPSLTITALAERAMSFVPRKGGSSR